MTAIADEGARQRFGRELDRNFWVIASAGSGKTRAITDRIVEIASRSERALRMAAAARRRYLHKSRCR